MNKQTQDTILVSLLQKYIENRCTEQELYQLLNWLKSSESLSEFDIVSDSLWSHIDERTSSYDEIHVSRLNKEVDSLLQIIKHRKRVRKKRLHIKKTWLYQSAAVLLLIIGIGISLLVTQKPEQVAPVFTEIISLRGETRNYTLADGTSIVLNSESKLRIPSDYNQNNRIIEMVGEGYFDVTPNPDKPFIIKSGETQVKVLGTSFNVKAYAEDDFMGVTVSTGKVLVNVAEQDLQLRVIPNEHLSVNKINGEMSKQLITENNYIKWMDGYLYFNKEPINEVIKTINRRYQRRVILQCSKCDYVITGTHDNKSIEAVVEAICFTTGLKSKEEDNNIILYDNENK